MKRLLRKVVGFAVQNRPEAFDRILKLDIASNTKVDFATVWRQDHTMAERTGDGAANFIAWVKEASA